MNKKSFTLAELAELTSSQVCGDPNKEITNVADLDSASVDDVSFLSNPSYETAPTRTYEKAMIASKAGVIFISPKVERIEGRNFLINENPSQAFQKVVEAFIGDSLQYLSGFEGISPSAVIHPTAKIGKDVVIGPLSVIDKDVIIGDRVFIGAGCYVGLDCVIDEGSYLYPHVTIRERCRVGKRVIIQSGAVIGSCGFGYTPDKNGCHIKINQVGIVVLEDDVDIGANTTIDRSRYKETIIGKGTKIDNLVQIGHGVVVGAHNIIVSQTGIAGSSKTGKHVVLAGQVAVAGHLSIASGTMIAGKSGVGKSIAKSGKYGGFPLQSLEDYQRTSVHVKNLKTYVEEIKQLKKRIETLESEKKIV